MTVGEPLAGEPGLETMVRMSVRGIAIAGKGELYVLAVDLINLVKS